MDERKYILSPCGISLLTNGVNQEERKILIDSANAKYEADVSVDERAKIREIIRKKKQLLSEADIITAARMSAEINGINSVYGGSFARANGDYHVLLSTDTWLGEETSGLVAEWLKKQNQNLIVSPPPYRHRDLQTREIDSFQMALSELIKRLSDEIPGYSKSGYKIIFNLTGGFKSIQGFLQSIANFYADETVYIFESSSDLMRIPRLPVVMDTVSVVTKNLEAFRRISLDLPVNDMKDIPETLLFTLDGHTVFSPWGEVIWNDAKIKIYRDKLLPSPMSEKIKYDKFFEKSIGSLSPDRIAKINSRIDELSFFLRDKTRNLNSLDFKQLVDAKAMSPSTHEIDAWSDGDAKRIYGHYENEVFVLDKIDKGLH